MLKVPGVAGEIEYAAGSVEQPGRDDDQPPQGEVGIN
jgi:hypothetical protein